MSDTYIPGVKSRFDTEKMIEGLMKVERVPKERAEQNVKDLETQKGVWLDLGKRMSNLRESSKVLYSFQNPFNDRIATSADESVVSGIATRDAEEQERSFIIKRLATSDRFLSKPLSDTYKIPAGEYHFDVGATAIDFTFRGGSLKEFTEALNRRGKDAIKASTIVVEPGTKSLLIEALVTGSANRLGFAKAAEQLALDTEMVSKTSDGERIPSLAKDQLRPVSGPLDTTKVLVDGGSLEVKAKGEARIPISPAIAVQGELTLEAELKTAVQGGVTEQRESPPQGPELPSAGSISYEGITIENDQTDITLPPWKDPPIPPRVDDNAVLRLGFTDGSSSFLPAIRDSTDFEKYSWRLSDVASGRTISSIDLVNRNTHRDISLRALRIFDPAASGGFKPVKAISTAGDAIVQMDGIEVVRSSNEIKDLIPGVTVTARGASEDPVKLKIEPDRKGAKDSIITLVFNYNRLMAETNVLSRNDEKILRELDYLKDDEKKDLEKKLGALQGDSTVNQIKQSLQKSAASPYTTSAEREMALLAQIGISTDAARAGARGGVDQARLRGYLEIDEKVLDKALLDKLPAVKELFGYDTDNDKVIDSGFGWAVDNLMRAYVETGGIISLKTGTIDTKVTQEKKRIETLDKQLATKEADLKKKYGMMEGSLNSMEGTSSRIEQFGKTGQ